MELTRLSRVMRDRWRAVVLISVVGFVAAFGLTTLSNTERESLYQTVISLRFDPEEGETIQDLVGEVEDALGLALFANEELLAQLPNATIFADTGSGRIFFQAQGETRQASSEGAQALVQNYLNTDPVVGGDINQQLEDIAAEAAEVEAQMAELEAGISSQQAALGAQHDLLDRQIAAVNDRIVALTTADIGATAQEQAQNAAQRNEAEQILAGLLAERAVLPPRPAQELSAGERLELRALQRRLDFLGLDYERLSLRTAGVAGRGGRTESVDTADLTPEPANPVANGAMGLVGGIGLALFALVFITRARKEVWLGDDLPVPLLGEIPIRKVSSLPGPPWYDGAPGGRRKNSIQAVRTAIEGSLDHTSAALTVVGDHVDSTTCRALAADLAAAFASAGRSVLLVDADYSEPSEMTEYNVGEPTLATVLGLPAAVTETMQERVSRVLDEAVILRTDLAVMPAGPEPDSPADAVAGRQLRVFLEQAATRFDLVIVVAGDMRSPAAQVLTQRVGSAVLAVAPGKTTMPHVASLVTDLTQQRVRLLGAVMIQGKESFVTLPSLSNRSARVRPSPVPETSESPITRLSMYPFPGSKRSGLLEGGSLRELADGLADGREDGEPSSESEEKPDQLGVQVLEALRGSDRDTVHQPVADYVVARVEDLLTAVPGQANVSDELMNVVLRYGFIPLTAIKGQRTVGEWLVEELRAELGREQGEEIAEELAQVLVDGDAPAAQALNVWITSEFFARHLDRTEREPELWHLTSEAGTVQVLVHGRRLNRERLGALTTGVVRGTIDDLQRQLKRAADAGDVETATLVEVRLKELHLFEIALGLLQVGSNEDGRVSYPWRRGDQQAQGWTPVWADGVRPNIAPLQKLGLLAAPVLTDEELMLSQSSE